jgi:hypothetical protein
MESERWLLCSQEAPTDCWAKWVQSRISHKILLRFILFYFYTPIYIYVSHVVSSLQMSA